MSFMLKIFLVYLFICRKLFNLTEDMKITLQTYDGKPMSATVPSRVTCTVSEAQPTTKGQTATPQYVLTC